MAAQSLSITSGLTSDGISRTDDSDVVEQSDRATQPDFLAGVRLEAASLVAWQ